MEAVPRLPMISFELKTSPENPSFGPALKEYIATFYNEDPESYNNEIHKLECLRNAAVHPSTDVSGVQTLKKYYCQLHFLKSRFPMDEGDPVQVYFSWRDSYTNVPCSEQSIQFELMCILYNIGALHSQLGALDSRNTPEGMKMACTHLQCAAWAFQTVRENYMINLVLTPTIIDYMRQVCLAQAQECILEKSMMDNRKATIIAKVAVQVVDYYKQALQTLQIGGNEASMKEMIGNRVFKDWIKYLSFKVSYYKCIALLYQGQQAEELQKMGERVAFYQFACEQLEEARKLSANVNHQQEIGEALAFTLDVVEGKRKAAKNENEFIYHEDVPERDALQEVKGASLVKGIPFNVNDIEVSEADIFARLVPMEAHEASSMYSEQKAQMLRQFGELIESKDQTLAEFMSSLKLDFLIQMRQANGLSQELVDRAAAISARPSATQDLVNAMQKLSDSYHEVEAMLNEIQELLKEEEQNEKEYQTIMGKRPPSIIATDLSREAAKYREAHNKASESNQNLHKAMVSHIANLKILAQPLSQLKQQIPSIEMPNANIDEKALNDLETLRNKVEEMKSQRVMLWNQLRDAVHQDDITSVLVTRQPDQPLDSIFQQELEKHKKLGALIEQNIAAQDNITKAFVDTYAHFTDSRRYIQDVINHRTSTISALITSYDTYDDLLGKANKGIEFYNKLETNVSKLLQRIKSASKVQEEEREQMLSKNSVPKSEPTLAVTTTAASTAPKLKDYLDSMKKDGGIGSTLPYTNPAYNLPSKPDQTWPPAVRPAPLGSEMDSDSLTLQKNNEQGKYGVYNESPAQYAYQQPYIYGQQQPANAYGYQQNVSNQQNVGYTSNQPSAAYAVSQVDAGYGAGQPSTGYTTSQLNAGYVASQQPNAGYSANQSNSGYTASQPNTGYTVSQPNTANQVNITYAAANQLSTGYVTNQLNNGYSANQPSTGYTAGQLNNGYATNQPNAGYTANQSNAGYAANQSNTVYTANQSNAGYGVNQPNAAYTANQPNNTYKPSQLNSGNQQNAGYTTNQATSAYISNQQNTSNQSNYGYTANQQNVSFATPQPNTGYVPSQQVYNYSGGQQTVADYNNATDEVDQELSNRLAALMPSKTSDTQFSKTDSYTVPEYNYNTQTYHTYSGANYSYPVATQENTATTGMYQPISSAVPNIDGTGGQQTNNWGVNYSLPNDTGSNAVCGQTTSKLPPVTADDGLKYQQQQPVNIPNSQYIPMVDPYYPTGYNSNYSYPYENFQAGVVPYSQTDSNTSYSTDPYGYSSLHATYQDKTNQFGNQYSTQYPIATSNVDAVSDDSNNSQNIPYNYYVQNSSVPSTSCNYYYNNANNGHATNYVNNTVQAHTSVTSTNKQPTPSTSQATTPVPELAKKSSTIDLLSGLDFSISDAPLVPEQKPAVKIEKENASIKPEPQKHSAPKPVEIPTKTVMKNLLKEVVKLPNKNHFEDAEVSKNFVQEVDKYEKFVDGLTVKTLNGPTTLDVKWKEIQDKQEIDLQKKSISVARCYPMKNRFPDILPYDHSRVELQSTKDDYINASYIKDVDPHTPNFIVTQSPTVHTCHDFWVMVREQNVEIIVCLLNNLELGEEIYWPKEKGEDLTFPNMIVSLQSIKNKTNWNERMIVINRPEQRESRTVLHLQFTTWPGSLFPVPASLTSFVNEIITLHQQQRSISHPLLVHCLSGVGRTGVFCLLMCAFMDLLYNPTPMPDLTLLAVKLSSSQKNILRDREHLKFAYQVFLSHMKEIQQKILGIKTSHDDVTKETSEVKTTENDPLSTLDPFWASKRQN